MFCTFYIDKLEALPSDNCFCLITDCTFNICTWIREKMEHKPSANLIAAFSFEIQCDVIKCRSDNPPEDTCARMKASQKLWKSDVKYCQSRKSLELKTRLKPRRASWIMQPMFISQEVNCKTSSPGQFPTPGSRYSLHFTLGGYDGWHFKVN